MNKFLKLFTYFLAVCSVAIFAWEAFQKITFPYGLGLGEAPLSQAARLLSQGQWPYQDPAHLPHRLVPYGPVYLALSALLQGLFKNPFLAGRLLTLLAAIGASWMLYRFLRAGGLDRSVAILSASMFLVHGYTRSWGVVFNVDMTGIFLNTAAAYFFARDLKDSPKGLPVWAVILQTAAFFTKSSMVAPGAAFFVLLLWERRYQKAIFYALLQGTLLLSLYGALCAVTGGQYYFHTTYEIGKRLFFSALIGRFWLDNLVNGPLLVAACIFFFWTRPKQAFWKYTSVYLVIVLCLTVSLGKQGSDTNYLLEWVWIACAALGCALTHPRLGRLAVFLWIGQVLYWGWLQGDPRSLSPALEARKKVYDNVSTILRRVNGPILSTDMGLLAANHLDIYYEPFPMGQMSYSGVWDESIIEKEFEQGFYKLVILYFDAARLRADRNFTQRFMQSFKAHYHRVAGVSVPAYGRGQEQFLFFYEPNKR